MNTAKPSMNTAKLMTASELGAAVWTSSDGEQWSRVSPSDKAFATRYPEFGFTWMQGVAASEDGQRLVAVGLDSKMGFGGGQPGAIWFSLDGESWNRIPHDDALFGGGTIVEIEGVVAGGPGFVAVGTEAESTGGFPILPWTQFVFKAGPIGRARGVIWTSADGLDWTRIPDQRLPHVGEENVRLRAISRGRPGLVAVGWRGPRDELDSVVWTSPDGETWGLASDLSDTLRDLGGQFLADVIPYGRGLVAAGADGSPDNYTAAVWTSP